MAATHKFSQRGLRQLVGVQVGRLFHQPQAFDRALRANAPAHAQTGESNLREAVDLNHVAVAVQRLQRRQRRAAQAQPPVNVILDHRYLIARRNFQQAAPFGQRHSSPGRIMKIRGGENKFHAVLHQHRFQSVEVQAHMPGSLRVGLDANRQHSHASAGKNRYSPRIRRVFQHHSVARAQKRLAHQIDGLLAAVGNQQLFAAHHQAFLPEEIQQHALQRLIPIGRTELQYFASFVAQHGVGAASKLFHREKFFGRARGDESN